MTTEQAIQHGNEQLKLFVKLFGCSEHAEFIGMSIDALEKQIQKKPYKRMMKFDTMDVCPICGVDTPNPREIEPWEWFCPDCGQAIDWSVEE